MGKNLAIRLSQLAGNRNSATVKKWGKVRALISNPARDKTFKMSQNVYRPSIGPSRIIPDVPGKSPETTRRLKLLSYNIQTGIAANGFRHYLMQTWKHLLPCPKRLDNLDCIARLLGGFDLVGLQEVDGGSLRSGFINQTEYLALAARFPYWYDQTNRNFGVFAQHSMGILSRLRATEVSEQRLPGAIPGRGALIVRYGRGNDSLAMVLVHLALGRRARMSQMAFIGEISSEFRHVIVMGDLNCRSDSPELASLISKAGLCEPAHDLHTFPSWRPSRNIDHILVSPSIAVNAVSVLNYPLSDHLPIAMEVTLPDGVNLQTPHYGQWDHLSVAPVIS